MGKGHSSCGDFCLIIVAIFLPFLTVAIRRGICSLEFLLSILLTIAFHVPAIVYAIYIVLSDRERALARMDIERGCSGTHTVLVHHCDGGRSPSLPKAAAAAKNQRSAAPSISASVASSSGPTNYASTSQPSGEPPRYSEISPQFATHDNKVQSGR